MADPKIVKELSNGDITVVWDKSKCTHDGICVQDLSSVFSPDQAPNLFGAPTSKIIATVAKCTTGALRIKIGSHEWI